MCVGTYRNFVTLVFPSFRTRFAGLYLTRLVRAEIEIEIVHQLDVENPVFRSGKG